jgi:hypothetical protein
VVENARAAVERAAVANGRLTASRIAIACVSSAGEAARCSGWAGNGVVKVATFVTFSNLESSRVLACWPVPCPSVQPLQCNSLQRAPPSTPPDSSASLSLTRPAFVCVFCICHASPTTHHDPQPSLYCHPGTLPPGGHFTTRSATQHVCDSTPAMSRLQYDQFVDDDEDECCPLCVEEFDLSDRNFRPCPCGYQVRRRPRPGEPLRVACANTVARYVSSATTTSRQR